MILDIMRDVKHVRGWFCDYPLQVGKIREPLLKMNFDSKHVRNTFGAKLVSTSHKLIKNR